jgi:hypothetical protein
MHLSTADLVQAANLLTSACRLLIGLHNKQPLPNEPKQHEFQDASKAFKKQLFVHK